MKVFIALLRGINVSGQKKIKMADLKKHLEDIGFERVETYIQSGNIVFGSELDPRKLEGLIAEKIKAEYSWDVPVMVKSLEEFENTLISNPFLNDRDKDKLYYTFLSEEPELEQVEKLKEYSFMGEEYEIKGKVIFFYAGNGYGRAKMNNNFSENKLKVSATTRNWKTVKVLYEMSTE